MSTKTFKIDVKGKYYNLRLLGTDKIPDFAKITSVSAVIFDEADSILAVRLKNRGIDIPGGHTEPGDANAEETLRREVLEEASATIKGLTLIEVIESDYFGSNPDKASYMLIYAARVDQLLPYDESDNMASERVALTSDLFLAQYSAGDTELMEELVKKATLALL